MMSSHALARLRKEYIRMQKNPVDGIEAVPLESNILVWHYAFLGPKDSVYEGGVYHGKLTFPKEYPFKPPEIVMITENGRFATNTPLCMSMSNFHPESWNPLWSVSSILAGLVSFMVENSHTAGSLTTSIAHKRRLCHKSLENNLKNPLFVKLFPHFQQHFITQKQKKLERLQAGIPEPTDVYLSQTEIPSNPCALTLWFMLAGIVLSLGVPYILGYFENS